MAGSVDFAGGIKVVSNDKVIKGTLVVLDDDGHLVYAGPVESSPEAPLGMTVLANPSDFEVLIEIVRARRNWN